MAIRAIRFISASDALRDVQGRLQRFQPGEAFLAKAMEDPAGTASDLGSVGDQVLGLLSLPDCCGSDRAEARRLKSEVSQMLQQLEHQLDPNPIF